MEISITDLKKGLPTKIKDKSYLSTEEYVTPFIEMASKLTDEFIIQVKPASQISLTRDGDVNFDNMVYNRVWIQAVLPGDYAYENHSRSLNLLYALDSRKPVYKIFENTLNRACLNMCVFNPDFLSVSELEPESQINLAPLKTIMSLTNDTKVTLDKLANMEFKKAEIFDDLGRWVDRCINSKINSGFGTVKLSETTPIEAYKKVFYDEKSPYYTKDKSISGLHMYNAFTQIITDDKKDITNHFEKTLLVKEIMAI